MKLATGLDPDFHSFPKFQSQIFALRTQASSLSLDRSGLPAVASDQEPALPGSMPTMYAPEEKYVEMVCPESPLRRSLLS
jgi:hypothetical protein